MPITFLTRRAPAARARFHAVSDDFPPQGEEDAHFQEKHLFRVLQSADTNG